MNTILIILSDVISTEDVTDNTSLRF